MKARFTSARWGRRATSAVLAGLLTVGALTACGGSSDDSATADSGGAPAAQYDAAAKSGGDADRASVVSPESARASVGQKLVRRANLNLKVDSLTGAAQRIRAIAAQQGGVVVTEELYSGEQAHDTSGTMTINVPATSLDATIALIEKVGDVQFRNTSSEDVTAAYVDTEARVKSMTASVQRIRDLIAKASTVNDLVALENELSQRQAELDSLTAQLTNLKDQVAESPITISLSTDDFEAVTAPGFLSGLKSGWSAFVTSLSVLVTVLGAVLPFVAALALVLVPLLWWLRRRRAGRLPLVAPVAQPAGPAPPSAG
ncbi:DUF4349 domain-containing protein [Knoellia subterranea]|uniref:DUF4349 domain-containing protein n=1 Tax=Knoellia subterranea KCTC 19937 TaxID=1385521 RepID=A0A0A0JMD6_9MICO|nr:DUF4349 domain-containing protein [Knoellia subterranea]KGN38560.1 hypothetical protein N803_07390 [Knoellia subterranea KCTC 19937]